MRRITLSLFVAALSALPALAQRPPDLQPIPEPSPPPPVQTSPDDPNAEPQVTIRQDGDNTVQEYRVNGRLYIVKVTPKGGVPFYLVDERGDGSMTRKDSLDTGLRPPLWSIFSW